MMGPKLSRILLDELNKIRAKKGLHKLKWDKRLYEWAVWWAMRMYKDGWFGHVNPNTGRTLFDEKEMLVVDCICKIPNRKHRPSLRGGRLAMNAWFESKKGHRGWLLIKDKNWNGAAFGAYGNIYVFLVTNYEPCPPPG